MANDKNKTGRTPQNDDDSTKPAGSGGMKQKSDRDAEGRYTHDSDPGSPKGGSTRGSQISSPDRNSQRIDDDDEEDDMDFRPGKGAPRRR